MMVMTELSEEFASFTCQGAWNCFLKSRDRNAKRALKVEYHHAGIIFRDYSNLF
jgi:hypothetical protein